MRILHVIKVVSITLMIAAAPIHAEPPYLVEYDGSPDLPNGIAFHITLTTIKHFHTESGGIDAAVWVAGKLELSNVDSHNFVSQALTTLYLIDTEVSMQLASHSCRFVGEDVSKKDKYAALQQTYDIRSAIYDDHYDQLKASLDPNTRERLQRWMDESKLNTGHYQIDFEEADRRSGRDATETLSGLCGRAG